MIPKGITADHIRLALKDLDEGQVSHRFGESTGYDMLFEGRRYPPKAIVGLAARHLPGRSAPLTPDDFSGGEESSCFRLLRKLGFQVVPKVDPTAGPDDRTPEAASADAERTHRLTLWHTLASSEPVARKIEPARLRALGVYGGAQGIWVDAVRTSSLTTSAPGVTVGVLHTGSSYADDLSDDGILYHYPSTRRSAGRDAGEVGATKAAKYLKLPIFVISHSEGAQNLRDVRLGWIRDWDDDDELFLITFEATESQPADEPEAEFSLFAEPEGKKTTTTTRPGQQKFKFSVIKRYGARCAVCSVEVLELLDAAHLTPKKAKGSDDPRNGLLLCASHHRAFDAGFFGIEPDTQRIRYRPGGPEASALGLTASVLSPKKSMPHPESLKWLWAKWKSDY
jgi:hypothetical protein